MTSDKCSPSLGVGDIVNHVCYMRTQRQQLKHMHSHNILPLLCSLLPALGLGRVRRRRRALGRALGVLLWVRHVVYVAAVRAGYLAGPRRGGSAAQPC